MSKYCFGLSLATIAAKGLLIWSFSRFYESSDSSMELPQMGIIDPAVTLVSVVAIIGIIATVFAFTKGARGQLLYASLVLNSVALMANPVV